MTLTFSHHDTIFCVFCSIGGDDNLTTVTTLPSESSNDLYMIPITCWSQLLFAYCLFKQKYFILCHYFFLITDILKHFNQNLTGYSVGMGKQDTPQAFLNQAVAGAKSKWVLSESSSAASYQFIPICVVRVELI